MMGPGSPSPSNSSGTSDLMALLDQGLQSDQSDAEQSPPHSSTHAPEQYDMHSLRRAGYSPLSESRQVVLQG